MKNLTPNPQVALQNGLTTDFACYVGKHLTPLIFSVLICTSATVEAQIQSPLGLPTPKVGDVSNYRIIDLWNNTLLNTYSIELVELQGDRLMTKYTSSAIPAPIAQAYTQDGRYAVP